jgi:hypothetical protein
MSWEEDKRSIVADDLAIIYEIADFRKSLAPIISR